MLRRQRIFSCLSPFYGACVFLCKPGILPSVRRSAFGIYGLTEVPDRTKSCRFGPLSKFALDRGCDWFVARVLHFRLSLLSALTGEKIAAYAGLGFGRADGPNSGRQTATLISLSSQSAFAIAFSFVERVMCYDALDQD